MLAGRRLFDGNDELEIVGKVMRCDIPSLGLICPERGVAAGDRRRRAPDAVCPPRRSLSDHGRCVVGGAVAVGVQRRWRRRGRPGSNAAFSAGACPKPRPAIPRRVRPNPRGGTRKGARSGIIPSYAAGTTRRDVWRCRHRHRRCSLRSSAPRRASGGRRLHPGGRGFGGGDDATVTDGVRGVPGIRVVPVDCRACDCAGPQASRRSASAATAARRTPFTSTGARRRTAAGRPPDSGHRRSRAQARDRRTRDVDQPANPADVPAAAKPTAQSQSEKHHGAARARAALTVAPAPPKSRPLPPVKVAAPKPEPVGPSHYRRRQLRRPHRLGRHQRPEGAEHKRRTHPRIAARTAAEVFSRRPRPG